MEKQVHTMIEGHHTKYIDVIVNSNNSNNNSSNSNRN